MVISSSFFVSTAKKLLLYFAVMFWSVSAITQAIATKQLRNSSIPYHPAEYRCNDNGSSWCVGMGGTPRLPRASPLSPRHSSIFIHHQYRPLNQLSRASAAVHPASAGAGNSIIRSIVYIFSSYSILSLHNRVDL